MGVAKRGCLATKQKIHRASRSIFRRRLDGAKSFAGLGFGAVDGLQRFASSAVHCPWSNRATWPPCLERVQTKPSPDSPRQMTKAHPLAELAFVPSIALPAKFAANRSNGTKKLFQDRRCWTYKIQGVSPRAMRRSMRAIAKGKSATLSITSWAPDACSTAVAPDLAWAWSV